jgi:hypothetical protein
MADIDRQGVLRTFCSVNELITAYLALLTDALGTWITHVMLGDNGNYQPTPDACALYQVMLDQISHNGVGDLSPQYPPTSLSSSLSSLSSSSSSRATLDASTHAASVVEGDDSVVVFRSTYITKPKDSLRIYIPTLVWPSVADMHAFHQWWKARVEQQVSLTTCFSAHVCKLCLYRQSINQWRSIQ